MAEQAVNIAELQGIAKTKLPKMVYDYYASGADDELTLKDNRDAFTKIQVRPRILIDVSKIDMTTSVLGVPSSMPILIAPTAMQCMATSEGEKDTSRAAAKMGTIMTLSSWSTTALEDVADAAPAGKRFFQLYVYKDRVATERLVRRAEAAGYKSLCVTVDTPYLGKREADVKNKFFLPEHLTMGNFKDVASKAGMPATEKPKSAKGSGLASYVASQIDASLSWKDISWLKSISNLPIVVKGVLTAEDALIAVKCGCAGIWVSNHGARQLDTAPATIDVLEEIVLAVKDYPVEVYLDGGVRRGTDVLKALAIGAKAVFVGRPVVWGLSSGGEEGVVKALSILRDEFKLAMALAGAPTVTDIKRSMVMTLADKTRYQQAYAQFKPCKL